MIFSCLFDAFSSDECGRVFVYRKDGTRFDRAHIQMIHNSGRKSVPVWAWFSADGGGDFVRINGRFNKEKYLEILQNVLLPSIRQRFPDGSVNFIHDNSPIPSVPSHSASLSHGFRSTRKFECHGHQRVPTWTPLRMFGGTWSKKWKATKWRVPKKFLKGPVPFGKDLSAVPNIGANLLHQWAEDWLL